MKSEKAAERKKVVQETEVLKVSEDFSIDEASKDVKDMIKQSMESLNISLADVIDISEGPSLEVIQLPPQIKSDDKKLPKEESSNKASKKIIKILSKFEEGKNIKLLKPPVPQNGENLLLFNPPTKAQVEAALRIFNIDLNFAFHSPLLKATNQTYQGQVSTRVCKGDGNCGYRAISKLLTGEESFHWQIRLRNYEYIINNGQNKVCPISLGPPPKNRLRVFLVIFS